MWLSASFGSPCVTRTQEMPESMQASAVRLGFARACLTLLIGWGWTSQAYVTASGPKACCGTLADNLFAVARSVPD